MKILVTGSEVNRRCGPGLQFEVIGRSRNGDTFDWLATYSDGSYDWHGCSKGWMRSDLCRLASAEELQPAADYWSVSRYVVQGTFQQGWGGKHQGWDIAGSVGVPIYGTPGGIVTQINVCSKCDGPEGPSSYGKVPTQQVFVDPAWGNGWGHYVVVMYPAAMLPQRTQQMFPNQNAYVLYGHLEDWLVQVGQQIDNSKFALMGNTGNSSGPHLHIELRFSVGTGQQWRRIGPSVDPGVLFTR